jgi:hypothetical protein
LAASLHSCCASAGLRFQGTCRSRVAADRQQAHRHRHWPWDRRKETEEEHHRSRMRRAPQVRCDDDEHLGCECRWACDARPAAASCRRPHARRGRQSLGGALPNPPNEGGQRTTGQLVALVRFVLLEGRSPNNPAGTCTQTALVRCSPSPLQCSFGPRSWNFTCREERGWGSRVSRQESVYLKYINLSGVELRKKWEEYCFDEF